MAPHYRAALAWLETRLFPAVITYATHPITITLTLALIVPLIVFASITALSLSLGNYTNVISAAVSSIVLYQSMRHHRQQMAAHDAHAARADAHEQRLAALEERMAGKRLVAKASGKKAAS